MLLILVTGLTKTSSDEAELQVRNYVPQHHLKYVTTVVIKTSEWNVLKIVLTRIFHREHPHI